MKYFLAKIIEREGEPATFREPHPYYKGEFKYIPNPNHDYVDVKNPLGLELPELTRKPSYRNWDTLRDLGWYHIAIPGVCATRGEFELKQHGKILSGEHSVNQLMSSDIDGYLCFGMPETDEETLEIWMQRYDWYYGMSDDHRYWAAGRTRDQKIRDLVRNSKTLTPERATEIWNKYAPKGDKERGIPGQEVTVDWWRF